MPAPLTITRFLVVFSPPALQVLTVFLVHILHRISKIYTSSYLTIWTHRTHDVMIRVVPEGGGVIGRQTRAISTISGQFWHGARLTNNCSYLLFHYYTVFSFNPSCKCK